MSLPWVRLDTAMPRNHKILALLETRGGKESAFVYVCSLSYCGEQGLEGFFPKTALPFIHAKPADAKRLVDVGLWIEQPGGWTVNGWTDYQPTTEQNQRRSARARKAAEARWGKAPT